LEAETKEGFVILSERSEEVLLGIHFLRVFKKTLTLSLKKGTWSYRNRGEPSFRSAAGAVG
jgi:hypothetical protein